MWRINDPKQLMVWSVIYFVGTIGWVINAIARPSALTWFVAIIWVVVAGALLRRLLRVRRVGRKDRTSQ